jgi:hypothetical protein
MHGHSCALRVTLVFSSDCISSFRICGSANVMHFAQQYCPSRPTALNGGLEALPRAESAAWPPLPRPPPQSSGILLLHEVLLPAAAWRPSPTSTCLPISRAAAGCRQRGSTGEAAVGQLAAAGLRPPLHHCQPHRHHHATTFRQWQLTSTCLSAGRMQGSCHTSPEEAE